MGTLQNRMIMDFTHLKEFNTSEGYWNGKDAENTAIDIINITKANSMLEIGFNIGYSASMWLYSGINTLYVIDINRHKYTESAVIAVAKHFLPKQVSWIFMNSRSNEALELDIDKIDIAFIDGEYSYEAALNDSKLALFYGADWIVYDDAIKNHINGIYTVIDELQNQGTISIVKTYPMTWVGAGDVILCKVNK